MTWGRVGAALVALLAFTAPAHAATLDPPPPIDLRPVWSPDGSAIAFWRSSGGLEPFRLWVMRHDGTEPRQLVVPVGRFSPDWRWVLYGDERTGLRIVRPEGQDDHPLPATAAAGAVWAPDGRRIAYSTQLVPGAPTAIVVLDVETGELRRVTGEASSPVWSPDGRMLAFRHLAPTLSGESDIGIVNVDGTDRRLVPAPTILGWGFEEGGVPALAWSPDSRTLAIPHNGTTPTLWLVRVGNPSRRRVPLVDNVGTIEWSAPRTIIVSGAGLYRIDPVTGRTYRLSRFGGAPDVSRDSRWVVFDGTAWCANGIARVPVAGGPAILLTQDCRIVGTKVDDRLEGTPGRDVIVGGDGNDELRAMSARSRAPDLLDGGRGNDTLIGSSAIDVMRGGDGNDTFDGRGGRDVIEAVDGRRDVVACGTSTTRDIEYDIASVDPIDVVRGDCEHVYYPGRRVPLEDTALLVRVWRGTGVPEIFGRPADPVRRLRIRCTPSTRTTVCERLARAGNVFAMVWPDAVCPRRTALPGIAVATGTFRGRAVTIRMTRRDGCERAVWDLLGIPDVR